jgi:hypothetical protein
VCVGDPAECRPWPSYDSAGALTFGGLSQPLTVEPSASPVIYNAGGGLPPDLFQPGDEITVSAEGDVVPPFTAVARGVGPIETEPVDNDVVTLVDGQDFTFSWTAEANARMRIVVWAGGQFHGIPSPAVIECDVADTGGITIDRAVVEAFPNVGLGCAKGRDCSKFILVRHTRDDVATGGGTVTFEVQSILEYYVEHP